MNTAQKRQALLDKARESYDPQLLSVWTAIDVLFDALADRIAELAPDDQSDELEVVA